MMILDNTPSAGKLTEADMDNAHTGGWFAANEDQSEPAPAWPIYLCAAMAVALVLFAVKVLS